MTKVITGLHREPTFEELIRQRDPTVHVPIRSAWELRNSPFMSVFDAEWLSGVGSLGLLDHMHDEGDQHAQNRFFQELYRQAGLPYRAQGTPGGPPPPIPPSLGSTLERAGQHQDAAQQHMSTAAVTAVHQAMQHVMNAQAVAAQVTTSSLPEEDDVYHEPTRDPAVMARNWRRARRITHGVLHPTLGILGAAAGVGYEATATIMGAVGAAMGQWADDETEPAENVVSRSRKPPERSQASAHAAMLQKHLEDKDPPPGPPDSGGASGSGGPSGPRRRSGRSGGGV